ncbi:MAG: hypothetical protein JXA73_02825 [Acidobacteria bacterium]|nr:hypothetical protein [Acidobacteriota bacterium]
MREILKIPAFRVNLRRIAVLSGLAVSLVIGSSATGCIKQRIKTKVPQKILQARTATLADLIHLIQSYDRIKSLLSSNLEVTYFSGWKESGEILKIRKQPAIIWLRRPDSIHLLVQNFVSKSRELDLISLGDNLSVWVRRGNKLYLGKNSARELIVEEDDDSAGFTIPIRGEHIFDAIFPQNVKMDLPGTRFSLIEEEDSNAKYYVLGFYKEGAELRLHTERRIWIERSSLTVVRQQIYLDEGQIASDITYSGHNTIDGFLMPLKIYINRPHDGYSLDLEFKSWRINPDLADNAFVLTPPEGVEIIHLKEKAF